jgi:hypothetical protein
VFFHIWLVQLDIFTDRLGQPLRNPLAFVHREL